MPSLLAGTALPVAPSIEGIDIGPYQRSLRVAGNDGSPPLLLLGPPVQSLE